jgi:hypothetical protein
MPLLVSTSSLSLAPSYFDGAHARTAAQASTHCNSYQPACDLVIYKVARSLEGLASSGVTRSLK